MAHRSTHKSPFLTPQRQQKTSRFGWSQIEQQQDTSLKAELDMPSYTMRLAPWVRENNLLSGMFEPQPIQAKSATSEQEQENKTGLPNDLKASIESMSGLSMDDVKVYYNSSKPASLNALAYTQGTCIHVAPNQEKHLPHEAWHVVQQKQGRVKPTIQAKGVAINDDKSLETEAEIMGTRANQFGGFVSPTLQRWEGKLNHETSQDIPTQLVKGIEWKHEGKTKQIPENAKMKQPEVVFRGERDDTNYKTIDSVTENGFVPGKSKVAKMIGSEQGIATTTTSYNTTGLTSMSRNLMVASHYAIGSGGVVYAVLTNTDFIDVGELPGVEGAQEIVAPGVGEELIIGYRPIIRHISNNVVLGEFISRISYIEYFLSVIDAKVSEQAKLFMEDSLPEYELWGVHPGKKE